MTKRWLLLILNLMDIICESSAGSSHDKVIYCCFYHQSTSYESNFDISHIEPSLCSHLIYTFISIDANSYRIKTTDLEKYNRTGAIERMLNLKEKNKDLKILIGIGGWFDASVKYSKMAADQNLRNKFIGSILEFLNDNRFDGIDLAWDTPTKRGGKPEDKGNYVKLIKELSHALKPKGYLLVSTMRHNIVPLNVSYDLDNINYYVDFVHILAFDYHSAFLGVINANAPLRGRDENDRFNVEYSIKYLLAKGVTPIKIVLGLSTRGHTFILNDPDTKEVEFRKIACKRSGFSGPLTGEYGFIGYNEVCYELLRSSWDQYWDEISSTPYFRNGERIISYDNPQSIANKVELAMAHDLGGVSAYCLTTDDFRGDCKEDIDTYNYYVMRYYSVSYQRLYRDALVNLFLADKKNKFYVISDSEVHLRLPETNFTNYSLLRTINEAIPLALEEMKVMGEMEKLRTNGKIQNKLENFPCTLKCSVECENLNGINIF